MVKKIWRNFGKPRLLLGGFGLLTVLYVLAAGRLPVSAQAQPWLEEAIMVSSDIPYPGGWGPKMTADANGNLHVVFRGWNGDNYPDDWSSNAIYYTWWNGESWSFPIDIFFSSEFDIEPDGIATTKDGRVVVNWQNGELFSVASAPIGEANIPGNWTEVYSDVGTNSRLLIDEKSGNWFLSYPASHFSRLLFTRSTDGSNDWERPREIWHAGGEDSAVAYSAIAVGKDDSIHLAWTENTKEHNFSGEAIWHAQISSDENQAIKVREAARSETTDINYAEPALAVGPAGDIHLAWNNSVGSDTGRFHQWSGDNGGSWSAVTAIFPGLSGLAGAPQMVFDSAGILHFLTAANGDGYGYAVLREAEWADGSWSGYDTLPVEDYRGERPSVVLVEGNQLHMAWIALDINASGARGAGYSKRITDAPTVPSPGFSSELREEGQEKSESGQDSITLTEETGGNDPDPQPVYAFENQQESAGSPFNTVLVAILPTLAFVVLIVLFLSRRS